MILFIGEILADVVLNEDGSMRAYLGGAPFNAAVAAGRAGEKATFLGRVGDDPMGKFLKKEAKKYPVDALLSVDPVRPTTLAFVSVDETGERDFKFLRHDSADAFLGAIDEKLFDSADVIHLGSLLLSEKIGLEYAKAIADTCKKKGKIFSFDVNFRTDIFPDEKAAKERYLPLVKSADVVKFSEEETEILFGKNYLEALKTEIKNPLAVVTLGKRGCAVKFGDDVLSVPTIEVAPIDTTGAGDAFFGTFLAGLDREGISALTKESLFDIALKANEAGARATQHKGAL